MVHYIKTVLIIEHEDSKWKMVEMQSCKSRRDLQLLYKTYLHLSLYEIVMIFQNIMYIGELPHIRWSLEKIDWWNATAISYNNGVLIL
jgi:hypothetical protein